MILEFSKLKCLNKRRYKKLRDLQEKLTTKVKETRKGSPEKESTESFEDLGKGLVLIVSGEDALSKSNKRINSPALENESKNAHSKTNSKGQTRDADHSDEQYHDSDNKLHLSIIRNSRKDSASFTAVFGSENMSNNSVSPVSGSDQRNEMEDKVSNDAFFSQGDRLVPNSLTNF